MIRDTVKPRFRTTIRKLVSESNSDLRRLIRTLPAEIEHAYLTTCEKNPYFTNLDLWNLYKNIPGATDLVVAHGHISQQACADLVHAGATGTHISALEVERFDWKAHLGKDLVATIKPPMTFDEVLERADFALSAPALEVLALLTPDEVMQLRETAEKTVFKIAREAPHDLGVESIPSDFSALPTLMKPAIESFRTKYVGALEEYWNHVCDFVSQSHPQQTRVYVRSCFVPLKMLSQVPSPLRTSAMGIALYHALNAWMPDKYFDPVWKHLSSAGASGLLGWAVGELAGHLVLERTPAMKELLETDLSLSWKPKGLFATNRWR